MKYPNISSETRAVSSLANLERALTELEMAWREDKLTSALERINSEDPVVAPIIEFYASLATAKSIKPSPFREDEFNSILAFLKQNLRAPKRWFAAVAERQTEPLSKPETASDSLAESPIYRPSMRLISVETPSGSVSLRIDQVIASRRWAIGFVFADTQVAQTIESIITHKTVTGLTARLRAGQKVKSFRHIYEAPSDPATFLMPGTLFENLMIDILNEERRTTFRAPIDEDLLEKTDLRVCISGLNRKRGARVQVTQTTDPLRYQEKLSRIKLLREFVILSPVSLAEALMEEGIRKIELSTLISAKELNRLWNHLQGAPKSVADCASKIKTTLLKGLEKSTEHPLGPMASVPPPLRAFIRNYVMNEAYRTTDLLRQREKTCSQKRHK
jgi:hypothetical protein